MSLGDRWRAARNRLIGSARFQRWAAAFPLTRPVARRRSRATFDLVAGFVYSQVLSACVTSGLLDLLAPGPRPLAEIAGSTGLSAQAAFTLLRAAESLRLIDRAGTGWALGEAGAAILGAPGVLPMIRHHALLYADLADPLAMLRCEGPSRLADFWRYRGGTAEEAALYSELMADSVATTARLATRAYDFCRHRRLLDVGGGTGAFLAEVAAAAPRLEIGLFDRPQVIQRARALVDPRIRLHAGDFLSGPLPPGHDCISLVRVLHDHDDAPAQALLSHVHAALPPGGRLVIVEPMVGSRDPSVAAYFGFYLAAMRSGRPRSPAEIVGMARAAGFSSARARSTALPSLARLVIAVR